jgi:ubiquinone/menaquinone biosynthesis C-methylase UbiE
VSDAVAERPTEHVTDRTPDGTDPPAADPLQGLARYYARRATEYERIYARPERQRELRHLQARVTRAFAGHRVLEVACGTGWWTVHGARHSRDWLATDVNPETLAIAATKPLPSGVVRFARADAFALDGMAGAPFDAAFAGFWWSHVPKAALRGWLARLHAVLEPGARVVFIDNRFVPGRSTPIARRDADGNGFQRRTLDDGSVHEVLKNFPTREEALRALGALGSLGPLGRPVRGARWLELEHYWLLSYTLA